MLQLRETSHGQQDKYQKRVLRRSDIKQPFCNTHLIFYEEAEFKTILFESVLCNEVSFKAILFQGRFKNYLEKIALAMILIYIFIDIAFKFKLLAQSRLMEYEQMKKAHRYMPEPSDIKMLKENSIFEMYFYSTSMRLLINRLMSESLLQIGIAVNILFLFYKTVSRR